MRFIVVLPVIVLVACGEPPLADGFPNNEINCTTCHGRGDDPAPPRALDGSEDTSRRGVGAHRKHLRDGSIRGAIACRECHLVPTEISDEGHVDALPAEITFGPLASSHDARPRWSPETLTCATYCHGKSEPVWTRVDGSQSRCDSCHGAPPPAPHPRSTRCVTCHADTVDELGRIRLDLGKHIDGEVQSLGTSCTSCHDASRTGSHAAHFASATHLAVDCNTCHIVPSAFGDPGHADDNDLRAEITFSGLAVHEDAQPRFAIAEGACSNTYCHGGDAPRWSVSTMSCDSCHGFPPAAPHPARNDCAQCHGMVVNANLTFVAPQLHVDGVVQSAGTSCVSCHGGQTAAPPRDTLGNTATTSAGVGAHATHLAASNEHAPIECSDCHVVPEAPFDPGHADSALPAEIVFSARAGADASYDGASCSNVACHGDASPVWTVVDGSQRACNSCHANPPAAPHPDRTDCTSCHGTLDQRHVNGVVDVSCTACHGSGDNPAPPTDLAGNTSTTSMGVGAHQAHLTATVMHGPVACSECHAVPTTLDASGHRDSALPAEIQFGSLARTDGTSATFNGLTCATYCHGPAAPRWNVVDGTQAQCGSCHQIPPPPPHPAAVSCGGCHPFVGREPIDPALHVNGVVERP